MSDETLEAEAASSPAIPLSPREIRAVMVGLMLVILLGGLEQTIVAVSLPMMSADLHGVALLPWVVSGYLIAVAVSTPIYGKLGDLYGRRIMLFSAIVIFMAASALCALATSMPMLVGARVLQGIGGAGLLSTAQAIIADIISPRERGRFQGYISTAFAIASVMGPLAGGLLTQYASWRWIFWINLPLGAFALAVSLRTLARLPVPGIKRPVDYGGAILLILGLTPLLTAITRIGHGAPPLDMENTLLFSSSFIAMLAFVWQELRTEEPIIPLGLLRNPVVALSCLILLSTFIQLIALSVLIPLRLQILTGSGADGAAYQLIPLSFAIPMGAYLGGQVMSRTGRYKKIQLLGAIVVPLMVAITAYTNPAHTAINVLATVIAGFAIGIQLPTATVAGQNAVNHRHVGIVTALGAFSRSLGAALGIAILMAVLFAQLHNLAPQALQAYPGAELLRLMVDSGAGTDAHALLIGPATQAFQVVFLASALAATSTILFGALIPDRPLSSKRPPASRPAPESP